VYFVFVPGLLVVGNYHLKNPFFLYRKRWPGSKYTVLSQYHPAFFCRGSELFYALNHKKEIILVRGGVGRCTLPADLTWGGYRIITHNLMDISVPRTAVTGDRMIQATMAQPVTGAGISR